MYKFLLFLFNNKKQQHKHNSLRPATKLCSCCKWSWYDFDICNDCNKWIVEDK